jgi:tetratricopeptide (TPR) repeat protein
MNQATGSTGRGWLRNWMAPAMALGMCLAAALPVRTAAAANPPPAGARRSGPAAADPFAALANDEKELGKQEESNDNPLAAAYHYDMVANLSGGPARTEYRNKAAALRQKAKTLGDQTFKQGMAAAEKEKMGEAFHILLRSLIYDPTNQAALRKIKDELIGTSVVTYKTVEGDTLATIAEKNDFDDPSLAWYIAAYNDMSENARVKPGRTLVFPALIGVLPKASSARAAAVAQDPDDAEYDANSTALDEARELLNSSKFDEAVALAAKVLANDPVNKDAKEVANASNYGMGKRLADEKKYDAALRAFGRADPNYKDTRQQIAAVRGQIVNSADEHYSSGVKYFVNDDLDNAIKEFETTLSLNPNHPQAAKDLQQARETKEKLRTLK